MIATPYISVGIMHQKEISFVLNGSFLCKEIGAVLSGQQVCGLVKDKILFGQRLFSTLTFEATSSSSTFELQDVTIGSGFHWERKENQRFCGNLRFIVEDDQLCAINSLSVESYLESVISSEMSATSSLELLKAHAVISRSWAMKPIRCSSLKGHTSACSHIKWYERDAHVNFDVCADDHCQRYQGISRIGANTLVKQAIEETRGEVLTYNGEICDARFSKSCGGVTELFENCWADEHYDYLTAISDTSTDILPDLTIEENAWKFIKSSPTSFCNTNDKAILSQVLNNYDQETADFYRWRVHYTNNELSALIQKKSGIDFGKIIDLIPLKRGTSARIVRLKIVGTKRTLEVGKELEIRKWLSESHLYSSAFVVEKDTNNNFTLIGAGWGHGVGLCQIGAAVMAHQGYDYKSILQHYFRGAKVEKRW